MFIFPYYKRLFLKFGTCNGTTNELGCIGPADFLGSRDDTDRESVRLYRALARTLSADGLKGIQTETRLSREIQRYHESKSSDPEAYKEIKALQMSSMSDLPIANDVSILLSPPVLQSSSKKRDFILETIERAEKLAVSSRSGKATSKDFLVLSQFDAAPLIAFTATKETDYGTETDGRIPARCSADRTDQWADT